MKDKQHDYQQCPSNVCQSAPTTAQVAWFPDEETCSYRPRQKWLKNMVKISKLYKAGKINSDRCFTKQMLEKMQAVRKPTGIDPERAILT
jgi:hypothetical protein